MPTCGKASRTVRQLLADAKLATMAGKFLSTARWASWIASAGKYNQDAFPWILSHVSNAYAATVLLTPVGSTSDASSAAARIASVSDCKVAMLLIVLIYPVVLPLTSMALSMDFAASLRPEALLPACATLVAARAPLLAPVVAAPDDPADATNATISSGPRI